MVYGKASGSTGGRLWLVPENVTSQIFQYTKNPPVTEYSKTCPGLLASSGPFKERQAIASELRRCPRCLNRLVCRPRGVSRGPQIFGPELCIVRN